MYGGAGDDRFAVDQYAGEIVIENPGEGIDVVYASIDYAVVGAIEQLILQDGTAARDGSGTPGDNSNNVIIGNSAANTLHGYEGNDILVGGGGDDSLLGDDGDDAMDGQAGIDNMFGGLGDDRFVISQLSDTAVERPGEGIDTVYAEIDYTLSGNLEQLILREGFGGLNGSGDGGDNSIFGNNAANRIIGNGGSDRLEGAGGNDVIIGSAGRDTLNGGQGDDTLVGGDGTNADEGDWFAFVVGDGRDIIADFSRAQEDKLIIQSALAANFQQLISLGSTVGGNAVFNFAGNQSITINGVAHQSLTANDVIFL